MTTPAPIPPEAVAALAEILKARPGHLYTTYTSSGAKARDKAYRLAASEVLRALAANPDAARTVAAALLPDSLSEVAGIDGCIAIVQQSLDTVRGEDNESRTVQVSIAAREHIIRLLTAYRERALAALRGEK